MATLVSRRACDELFTTTRRYQLFGFRTLVDGTGIASGRPITRLIIGTFEPLGPFTEIPLLEIEELEFLPLVREIVQFLSTLLFIRTTRN